MKNVITADYLLTDERNAHRIVTAYFECIETPTYYWRVEWNDGKAGYEDALQDPDEVKGGRLAMNEVHRYAGCIENETGCEVAYLGIRKEG